MQDIIKGLELMINPLNSKCDDIHLQIGQCKPYGERLIPQRILDAAETVSSLCSIIGSLNSLRYYFLYDW